MTLTARLPRFDDSAAPVPVRASAAPSFLPLQRPAKTGPGRDDDGFVALQPKQPAQPDSEAEAEAGASPVTEDLIPSVTAEQSAPNPTAAVAGPAMPDEEDVPADRPEPLHVIEPEVAGPSEAEIQLQQRVAELEAEIEGLKTGDRAAFHASVTAAVSAQVLESLNPILGELFIARAQDAACAAVSDYLRQLVREGAMPPVEICGPTDMLDRIALPEDAPMAINLKPDDTRADIAVRSGTVAASTRIGELKQKLGVLL